VRRDQLLLLVQCTRETERLCAESHHSDDCQQNDSAESTTKDTRTLAPAPRGEHHEREHQAG
jgi:hypothetical protein